MPNNDGVTNIISELKEIKNAFWDNPPENLYMLDAAETKNEPQSTSLKIKTDPDINQPNTSNRPIKKENIDDDVDMENVGVLGDMTHHEEQTANPYNPSNVALFSKHTLNDVPPPKYVFPHSSNTK